RRRQGRLPGLRAGPPFRKGHRQPYRLRPLYLSPDSRSRGMEDQQVWNHAHRTGYESSGEPAAHDGEGDGKSRMIALGWMPWKISKFVFWDSSPRTRPTPRPSGGNARPWGSTRFTSATIR